MKQFLIIRNFEHFKKGEIHKGIYEKEGERTYIIFDPDGAKAYIFNRNICNTTIF